MKEIYLDAAGIGWLEGAALKGKQYGNVKK
jgi:hypothetical protein